MLDTKFYVLKKTRSFTANERKLMVPFKKGINGKMAEVGSGCDLDEVILCHRRKEGL